MGLWSGEEQTRPAGSTTMERCKILNARSNQDEEHEAVEEVKEASNESGPLINADGRSREQLDWRMGSIGL